MLPLIRTLDNPFVCGPQARFRTFPGNDILGTRGQEMGGFEKGGQKGGIQVPLYWTDATRTLMPALPERFFDARSAAMTELREFGGTGWNFDQGAARTCNGAPQLCYKHPWS